MVYRQESRMGTDKSQMTTCIRVLRRIGQGQAAALTNAPLRLGGENHFSRNSRAKPFGILFETNIKI